MTTIPKYVIIVSLDALGETDLENLELYPALNEFFSEAAYCKRVLGVYPTLTYPSHASIVTGLYPKNHGIVNNIKLQPKRKSPDWYWHRKNIKGVTFYDVAADYKRDVAAFLWPVTAKSKKIKYHLPEIFCNRRYDNQVLTSLRNGSKLFQLKMFLKHGRQLEGIKQPNLDDFVFDSALDTIKKYKPGLVMIHLTDLDTHKHYAEDRTEIKASLLRLDDKIKRLNDLLIKEDMMNETAVILLGDHSQLDCEYIVYPNKFFREKKWLNYDEKSGKITGWKVICNNCDGSAYIYIKNKYKKTLEPIVKSYIEKIIDSGKYGIESIYTAKEAKALGADPECSFMIEAKKGYYFQNDVDCRMKKIADIEDKTNIMLATHGYLPTKEKYHTFIVMKGVGCNRGEIDKEMCLIDEAPTIAALMGLPFPRVDGKIIKEFLKKDSSYENEITK